jgi:hypothetical protein
LFSAVTLSLRRSCEFGIAPALVKSVCGGQNLNQERVKIMSIEKKSLISTLKTTKKANITKEEFGQAGSMSPGVKSPARVVAGRSVAGRAVAGRAVAGKTVAGKLVAGRMTAGKAVSGRMTAGKKTAGRK